MSWKGMVNGFWFVRVVLVLWLVSSCFVVFLLGRIDDVVHRELYNFGLQFSLVWAQPYWAFLRLIYLCLAVPMFLSGAVLVLGFLGRSGRVERPVVVRREKVEPIREGNHLLASCPKCKRVFAKPLVMLDFAGGKTRLVNVCPYCSHVLGSAGEGVEVGVVDLQEREVGRERK